MEKQFISFPSIEQMRTTIKDLTSKEQFIGVDSEGKAQFDKNKKLSTLTFSGTVKLHGSNAGIVFTDNDMWAQSRKNIITPEKDNAGFATWVYKERVLLKSLGDALYEGFVTNGLDPEYVAVYGEWCGGNVQKGVSISGMEKMFVIFGVKYKLPDEDAKWFNAQETADLSVEVMEIDNCYVIYDFPTYEAQIDMNEPALMVDKLIEMTLKVEEVCPVGEALGRKPEDGCTTGEGIVWTYFIDGEAHRFKVKGEKHSSSKVKKLASVDIEKMNSVKEFVEYSVTENRLNQGIEQVFTINGISTDDIDRKNTGDFVKWIKNDIIKEELDTLVENGLEMKDVAGPLSKKAANWFGDFLMKN